MLRGADVSAKETRVTGAHLQERDCVVDCDVHAHHLLDDEHDEDENERFVAQRIREKQDDRFPQRASTLGRCGRSRQHLQSIA